MKVFPHFSRRLPAMAVLTIAVAISGCQKDAEPTDATDSQNTSSQNTDVQAVNTQTDTSEVMTDAPVSTDQQINSPLTILALGDSLTEGLGVDSNANYPAQLEASLKELGYTNAKVINSGLSGETSTGLVNRLDWVAQTKPDITILTIGANDAMRGLDVVTIEKNIRTAVKTLQDNGSEVILGGMSIYDNLGNDYVSAFSDIYPRVAKDMNVPLIPFFLEGVGGDPELNQADAIHPTKEGYQIIVKDNILPILKPEIQKLKASNSTNTTASNTPNELASNNTPTETTQ
ncbi:arylesterase [Psychrobacter fozii]|uniref:Acyl-CoA thioesterase-1 n=1 Tax=Psychrobacter fozii TaxID=198480 RepID=A0A2V4V1L5_9GAMM|nr:arylesterase [Psychrobacter fozii]PYE36438.1 acyl-CoA thioesterase-1 [Psychrobacter fozii]